MDAVSNLTIKLFGGFAPFKQLVISPNKPDLTKNARSGPSLADDVRPDDRIRVRRDRAEIRFSPERITKTRRKARPKWKGELEGVLIEDDGAFEVSETMEEFHYKIQLNPSLTPIEEAEDDQGNPRERLSPSDDDIGDSFNSELDPATPDTSYFASSELREPQKAHFEPSSGSQHYSDQDVPQTPPPQVLVDDVFSHTKRQTPTSDLRTRLSLSGWSAGEIDLAAALNSRGREPLLPTTWGWHFGSLPLRLFGPGTLIDCIRGPEFHAQQALDRLFNLGMKIRSNKQSGRPVERVFRSEINKYITWAEEDAGIASKKNRYKPIIYITTSNEGDDKGAAYKLEKRLIKKAAEYRGELRIAQSIEPSPGPGSSSTTSPPPSPSEIYAHPPPTLFGFLISRHRLAILSFPAANEDPTASMRCVGIFDFAQVDMDVWNGVAISFVIILARDWVRSFKKAQNNNVEYESEGESIDEDE